MRDYKRVMLLIMVLTIVAVIIAASAIGIMYRASVERERLRLADIVQGQARFLEAVARFDQKYGAYPEGAAAATLSQFLEAQRNFALQGLGESGEIALARRYGDDIAFLFRRQHAEIPKNLTVPWDGDVAEPMRAALSGRSGTMVGKDYAGDTVVAAFEPVAVLDLGIVAKIDLWEIRQRFLRSSAIVAAIGVFVVLGASGVFLGITEPMVQRLRDSEARFRGTFGNAAVGIAHVGINGAWLQVNQRLCEILGYSREELTGKTFQDVTHPDDLEAARARFARLARGEIDSYRAEKRYLHKDGHEVWVHLTFAIQRDAAGKPLYAISVIEDISARKATELALQQSEVRTRAILNASQDEILLITTAGIVLAINEAAERRLARRIGGTSPVGRRLDEVLPADAARTRLTIVADVAATARARHFDELIRGRWFEFWYYPVIRPDQPVSEVAIFAREITGQKRAESELRKLSQAIEQSPASVVITDPRGHIEYVNPKFTEVSGYTREETIGQNPRILKSGQTSDDEYERLWRTITAGGIWRGEFHNKRKNGDLYWELAAIAPVKDASGEITHFVGVKEDITDRKATEEQLRQSQKLQAVGQLTGGIAHDFNNLLAIIVGNLQLLQERIDADPRAIEMMADALWAAKRGADLTHRLLAFARRQPLQPDVVELNDVVTGVADLLRRTLGSRIEVRVRLAEHMWPAVADRSELERALVNLAVNARDAMPNGGVITLETQNAVLAEDYAAQYDDVVAGDYAQLAVTDTGAGMAAEVMKRAFEPFFTTKEVGQGSGLGLSMVYGFVKQSGGHVSLYSEAGVGTSVKIFLPRASDVSDVGLRPAAAAAIGGFVGRIALVVEDEPKLQNVAIAMLRNLGFVVLAAPDATAALQRLEALDRLDLLFTDIELPGGMNGLALAERVREARPGIGVIYASGYGTDVVPEDLRRHDGSTLLTKPYSRDQLAIAVQRVLT